MKFAMRAFVVFGIISPAAAARAGFLRKGVHRGLNNGVASDMDASAGMSAVRHEVANMVEDMIDGSGPRLSDITKKVNAKMDLSTAVRQLDGKLPNDVASLVHMTTVEKTANRLDEDSMQKARKILNNMMLTAWGELDDVVFECKEFQERNRGTYEQVVADLARLGSQLSRLGELRTGSQQGVLDTDRERKDAEERLDKITSEFEKALFENQREMKIRKNGLEHRINY